MVCRSTAVCTDRPTAVAEQERLVLVARAKTFATARTRQPVRGDLKESALLVCADLLQLHGAAIVGRGWFQEDEPERRAVAGGWGAGAEAGRMSAASTPTEGGAEKLRVQQARKAHHSLRKAIDDVADSIRKPDDGSQCPYEKLCG